MITVVVEFLEYTFAVIAGIVTNLFTPKSVLGFIVSIVMVCGLAYACGLILVAVGI